MGLAAAKQRQEIFNLGHNVSDIWHLRFVRHVMNLAAKDAEDRLLLRSTAAWRDQFEPLQVEHNAPYGESLCLTPSCVLNHL